MQPDRAALSVKAATAAKMSFISASSSCSRARCRNILRVTCRVREKHTHPESQMDRAERLQPVQQPFTTALRVSARSTAARAASFGREYYQLYYLDPRT